MTWLKAKVVLIDRMRALFKLAHGEFVAPQRVEQILETLPLIETCWVTGRASAEFPVAVIRPNNQAVLAYLGSIDDPNCTQERYLAATMVTVEMCQPGSILSRAVFASVKAVGLELIRPYELPRVRISVFSFRFFLTCHAFEVVLEYVGQA